MGLVLTLLATAGAIALLELSIRRRGATPGQLASLQTVAVLLGLLGLLLLFRGGALLGIPALATSAVAWIRALQLRKLANPPDVRPAPPRSGGTMSRAQALAVLGLPDTASEGDIAAAHRRLIAGLHPDQGGSDYLAAQINEARDVLLG